MIIGIIVFLIFAFVLLIYVMIKNVARGVFKNMVSRRETDLAFQSAPEDDPWFSFIEVMKDEQAKMMEHEYQEVDIESYDKAKLHGYLFDNKSSNTMIFVHGYSSNGIKEGAIYVNHYLSLGYNALIIEQRAHDKSEGNFSTFGISEAKDVRHWVDFINEKYDGEIVLHGTSMGASAIVSAAASDLNNVKALIVDCAFTSAYKTLAEGFRTKKIIQRMLMHFLKKDYLHIAGVDIENDTPLKAIEKNTIPALFIVGENDNNCSPDESKQLYDACNSKKDLLVVKDALHIASVYQNRDLYFEYVDKFIG